MVSRVVFDCYIWASHFIDDDKTYKLMVSTPLLVFEEENSVK